MGIFTNLFKKKKHTYALKAEDIKPILPNKGGFLATLKITVDGMPVGYMYREEPVNNVDNGWRFFSDTETESYINKASNTEVYDLNTIVNHDPTIIPYVDMPYGTKLERVPNTEDFRECY